MLEIQCYLHLNIKHSVVITVRYLVAGEFQIFTAFLFIHIFFFPWVLPYKLPYHDPNPLYMLMFPKGSQITDPQYNRNNV